MKLPFGFLVVLLFSPMGAVAAPVTNADIEKLLASGMSETVILNVINGGEHHFDTSSDALITLKNKGATPAILAAITTPATQAPAPATVQAPAVQAQVTQPANLPPMMERVMGASHGVILIDGDAREEMSYNSPGNRFAMRAFGFGGAANYLTLNGPHAARRLKNREPVFVILIPRDAQPGTQATLTLWATRKNGTREIMTVNAGMLGANSGFPSERIIPLEYVKAADQPKADEGEVRYELHTKGKLANGEYALILGSVMGPVYDFGVED